MAAEQMYISQIIGSRIRPALQFIAAHYVYKDPHFMREMSSAQLLVLSTFHSLLVDDFQFLIVLMELAHSLPLMCSSYLKDWLKSEFLFRQEEVAKVLGTLSRLVNEGVIAIPMPIITCLRFLEDPKQPTRYCDMTPQVFLSGPKQMISRETQVEPEDLEIRVVSDEVQPRLWHVVEREVPGSSTSIISSKAKPILQRLINMECSAGARITRTSSSEDSDFKESLWNEDTVPHQVFEDELVSSTVNAQRRSRKGSDTRVLPSSSKTRQVATRKIDPFHVALLSFVNSEQIDKLKESLELSSPTFHAVVLQGHVKVLHHMLVCKADPDIRNKMGMSLMQVAVYSNKSIDLIKLLLLYKATLDFRDDRGWTSLHHAAYHGSAQVASLLLTNGSNKEAEAGSGYRPLHIAAMFNHTAVTKILLDARANSKAKDPLGMKPVDWAGYHGNTQMLELLKD